MADKVEAVLAGEKSSFPENLEEKDATAAAATTTAFPAAIFAFFLAPPLSLLRHVACLCAGYLRLGGGLKPPAPAPASSSSSSTAASEDSTEVVLEVRLRGGRPKPMFKPPRQTRDLPVQSKKGGRGGDTN